MIIKLILGVSNFAFCRYFSCGSSGLYYEITGNLYILVEYIGVGLVVIRKVIFVYFLIYFNCSQIFFYCKLKSVITRCWRTVVGLPREAAAARVSSERASQEAFRAEETERSRVEAEARAAETALTMEQKEALAQKEALPQEREAKHHALLSRDGQGGEPIAQGSGCRLTRTGRPQLRDSQRHRPVARGAAGARCG